MAKRIAKYSLNCLLFLLLAAWSIHFIYPLFYSVSISAVHREQRDIIAHNNSHNFKQLCIDRVTFKNCYKTGSKELVLNGEYYDVAAIEVNGNTVSCTVLQDKEETRLDKTVISQLQHGQSIKNSKLACCWWPVISHYTSYNISHLYLNEIKGSQYPVSNDNFLHNGYVIGISEPPRLAYIA